MPLYRASSGGDIFGPASATDNAVARFDTTTGKLVQESGGVTIDDTGGVTTPVGSTHLHFNVAGANYEWAAWSWVANVYTLDIQKGGSGTVRSYKLKINGVDAITVTSTGIIFGSQASFGNNTGALGLRRYVVAVTSDGTESQAGAFVTNRGASATVTRTLQTYTDNIVFTRVASQAFRISPSTGKKFLRLNGTLEAADKYLELQSNGATIEVIYDGTDYVVIRESGTIAVQP